MSFINENRLDIVWDRYVAHSFNDTTREKRGDGNRVVVRGITPPPKHWHIFWRDAEHKTKLYAFLAKCISTLHIEWKEVYSTQDTMVVPSGGDIPHLAPCAYENSDSRLLHTLHCANEDHH